MVESADAGVVDSAINKKVLDRRLELFTRLQFRFTEDEKTDCHE